MNAAGHGQFRKSAAFDPASHSMGAGLVARQRHAAELDASARFMASETEAEIFGWLDG